MFHFDNLLSAKLCVDEQPGKKQEFKSCFIVYFFFM